MITLKNRFEEIIHLTWSEFVELEKSPNIGVDDNILCSLVRICADTDDMAAIKLAFDRIDGTLTIPIAIKVPKFYTRYVKATDIEPSPKEIESKEDTKEAKSNYDPLTAKLRATLAEMRKLPYEVVKIVMACKKAIDGGKKPPNDPMVKSVIVANLLKHVKKGRFRAVELVFDQIDGKLAKTVELLGGKDVVVDDITTLTAPAGAFKDEDGYYVAENEKITAQWLRGFAQSAKGLEILAEGLEDA